MPSVPLNARDPVRPKRGKRNVTYPYGDLRFARIIETRARNKGPTSNNAPFLRNYRDQQAFPGCLLISQDSDPGDDLLEDVTDTYETLPGPLFVDIKPYRETGIDLLTSTRMVAATAVYVCGEFQPGAVSVASIVDNGDGTLTVTFATNHELPPRCWVTFAGTNSTPVIDGQIEIVRVPAENQVVVAGTVSGAGSAAGTMTAINRITRQLNKVPNNVNILMKVETMVHVPSVSALPTRNVSAIVTAGSGAATVTLSAAHGLVAGDWAMFSGTNSVPKIDGPRKILSAPTSTTVTVAMVITSSGTAVGTMAPMGPLARFNEDYRCWKDYGFPDHLVGSTFYDDAATSVGAYNYHISWDGVVGLEMQDGYSGPCRARRLRLFFVGPPPDSLEQNLSPTFVMPSSGSFVIKGGSQTVIFKPDLSASTIGNSVRYRVHRIPKCTTGAFASLPGPSFGTVAPGTGQATIVLDIAESVPPSFTVGEIITLMGQPTKGDAGALYEVIVWFIYVPYTSGLPPP